MYEETIPIHLRSVERPTVELTDLVNRITTILLTQSSDEKWLNYLAEISQIHPFSLMNEDTLERIHRLTFNSDEHIVTCVLNAGVILATQARYYPDEFYHLITSLSYGMTPNLDWMVPEGRIDSAFDLLPEIFKPQARRANTANLLKLLLKNEWLIPLVVINIFGLTVSEIVEGNSANETQQR